jgi:hypothetical protein
LRQSIHKKTIETIINSGNHYLAAVKGNQHKLYQAVKTQFVEHDSFNNIVKGHGRIEKRKVSTAYLDLKLSKWSSIKTLIKIESERQLRYKTEFSTRYYISDLTESAFEFYQRIRGSNETVQNWTTLAKRAFLLSINLVLLSISSSFCLPRTKN